MRLDFSLHAVAAATRVASAIVLGTPGSDTMLQSVTRAVPVAIGMTRWSIRTPERPVGSGGMPPFHSAPNVFHLAAARMAVGGGRRRVECAVMRQDLSARGIVEPMADAGVCQANTLDPTSDPDQRVIHGWSKDNAKRAWGGER